MNDPLLAGLNALTVGAIAVIAHHLTHSSKRTEARLRAIHFRRAAAFSKRRASFLLDDEPTPIPFEPALQTEVEIIAWRAWRVEQHGDEALLRSVVVDTIWPPGRALEAQDIPPPRASTHGPGIYAAKNKMGGLRAARDWSCSVYGSVALWGRVTEHERGFRAQFAYPHRIICSNPTQAQALRRVYGCEREVDRLLSSKLAGLWFV